MTGEGYLKIDFEVDQTVHKGDTIKLHSQGYIYCQNKILPLDTLNLIIDKEFN